MDAPIFFDGFEHVPELREALLAYIESVSRTMTLADAGRWYCRATEQSRLLNLP